MGESIMALLKKLYYKSKNTMIKKIKLEIVIYLNSLIVEH